MTDTLGSGEAEAFPPREDGEKKAQALAKKSKGGIVVQIFSELFMTI